MNLPERFREHWDRLGGTADDKVAIAVSGGADSLALLRLCHALGIRCHVIHVNHGLRGAESDADAAFVTDLCAVLELPCFVTMAPVGHLPGNLEDHARKARLTAFADAATQWNLTTVATAHTADDNAETLLHRLMRGTGLTGLAGIPESRRLGPLRLVRPLLHERRDALRAYLIDLGQNHREDTSNVDLRFTRNRIRHELLPMLRTFNPNIENALTCVSRDATAANERLVRLAEGDLQRIECPRAGSVVLLDREKFSDLQNADACAVLRLIWQREAWPQRELTFLRWVHLAASAEPSEDLPGGLRIERRGNVILIGPRTALLGS